VIGRVKSQCSFEFRITNDGWNIIRTNLYIPLKTIAINKMLFIIKKLDRLKYFILLGNYVMEIFHCQDYGEMITPPLENNLMPPTLPLENVKYFIFQMMQLERQALCFPKKKIPLCSLGIWLIPRMSSTLSSTFIHRRW
jgi:hypothetical protein